MRLNYQQMGRLYRSCKTPRDRGKFREELREAVTEGNITGYDFSLREAAEHLVFDRTGDCCGREWVRQLDPRNEQPMLEADVVSTAAFSDITGQIVYTEVLGAYQNPAFLWPDLCTVRPTRYDGEKIPGITTLGDVSEEVSEGNPYPHVGVSQDYIEVPAGIKRGVIVPITKEAIFFDQTGVMVDRCRDVGKAIGWNKEKLIVDMATGQASTFKTGGKYKWRGTEYSTYQASTPWINSETAALVDWTDIDEMELLWDAMTDPWTGEPILIEGPAVLVPSALKNVAKRVISATEIVHEGATNATHRATKWNNPVSNYQVLTSPMVKARTSSDTKWFMGDFKGAFRWMEHWPLQVVQAPPNSEDDFNRDIVTQFKASERGVPAIVEPRKVLYSTGAG